MSKKRNMAVHNMEAMEDHRTGANKKKFHVKDLRDVRPKTYAQEEVFHAYQSSDHLLLEGAAGTGKTFLALYLALREVLEPSSPYQKVVIVRSVVPTREIGFLPGTEEEKAEVYEQPYVSICNDLFPFSKSYENLKRNHYVEFMTTSFVRGTTMDNCIVVVDELQNMTTHEATSVITRLGENSKLFMCGDGGQNDLNRKRNDVSGMDDMIRIADKVASFSRIHFHVSDIVRSGFVREFLIAKETLGL